MSPPLGAFAGCGIELEYAIVARGSLDVRPRADAVLDWFAGGPASDVARGALGWSNELVAHVLEIKNRSPVATLGGLDDAFLAEIAAANAALAGCDAMLLPTGMHPWMDPRSETVLWPREGARIYAAFDRIFDCRRHGWANVQSMHVNLPFADDGQFRRLHAAIRAMLPLVPALAASSPFVNGRRAGALDQRLVVYRDNSQRIPAITGAVVPDNTDSRAAYETRVLQPMYAAIAPLDPAGVLQHEWLNARGAIPRFDRSAIEIRLADVQENPRADLAIAAAIIAAVRALYEERWASADALEAMATERLAAILASCVQHAEDAAIDDGRWLALFGLGRSCRARDVWSHLVAATTPVIEALAPAALPALATIATRGTLARRIVAATGTEPGRARLRETYARLARCLADGAQFVP